MLEVVDQNGGTILPELLKKLHPKIIILHRGGFREGVTRVRATEDPPPRHGYLLFQVIRKTSESLYHFMFIENKVLWSNIRC